MVTLAAECHLGHRNGAFAVAQPPAAHGRSRGLVRAAAVSSGVVREFCPANMSTSAAPDLRDPVRLSALFSALALGLLPAGCQFAPRREGGCSTMNMALPLRALDEGERRSLVEHCAAACPDDATRSLVDCAIVVGAADAPHTMSCRYAPAPGGPALPPAESQEVIASAGLPGGSDGAAYCDALCKTGPGKDPTAGSLCAVDVDSGVSCRVVETVCHPAGRRPRRARAPRTGVARTVASSSVGRYFGAMSELERASIRAFEELAEDLDALGAPERMREATRRAANDERRHTRLTARVARASGFAPSAPRRGPPRVARAQARRGALLERVAQENAREGCLREAFGALVATVQSKVARDARIAQVMVQIAHDETLHAALSFEIHAWAMSLLSSAAQRRVRAAERRERARFERELAASGIVDPELAHAAGCPDREATLALYRAFLVARDAELERLSPPTAGSRARRRPDEGGVATPAALR